MQIVGSGTETFILLSGITVSSAIDLSENVQLQPADTSHLDLISTLAACTHPDAIAVAAAFIPRITAQLQIKANDPKKLASEAWNSSWDALLLSALLGAEVGFNLQSDVPARQISKKSDLRATNMRMNGLSINEPYIVTDSDSEWIACHFAKMRDLLSKDRFSTAVHCAASYRWHSMPRIQLAILWAGVEGLFGASSEIRFRISLYIARFLETSNVEQRRILFDAVKKLYNTRSAAVHGSKLKGDMSVAVVDSALMLRRLLRRCAEEGSLPEESKLVP